MAIRKALRSKLERVFHRLRRKTDRGGLARTSEHWAEELQRQLDVTGRHVHWLQLDAVQARLNAKVTGDPRRDPYLHFLDVLQARGHRLPVERSLTLGSGSGVLERGLCQYGFCDRHDGLDICEPNVRHAREEAGKAGFAHLHYEVADVNRLVLPEAAYDAVWFTMSAHHFEALEHVFEQVRRTLKPQGMTFLNEYVGPSRFQWTDRQLRAINDLLRSLPERLRTRSDGSVKTEVARPTISFMLDLDPSEAVRSAEILPVLQQQFRIVERKDYGGSILHMLLHEIAFNFEGGDPDAEDHLRRLFRAEDELMASGEVGSDFAVVIAEPRP